MQVIQQARLGRRRSWQLAAQHGYGPLWAPLGSHSVIAQAHCGANFAARHAAIRVNKQMSNRLRVLPEFKYLHIRVPGIDRGLFNQLNAEQRLGERAQALQHCLQREVEAHCVLGDTRHVLANFFREKVVIPRF